MDVPGPLQLDEVMPKGHRAESFAVYDWYSSKVTWLNSTNFTLSAGYEGHGFGMLSPVVGGWVFIGERAKLVPAASLRFKQFTNKHGLTVQVAGVTNEQLEVCAAEMQSGLLVCKQVSFQVSGTTEIEFSSTTVAFI